MYHCSLHLIVKCIVLQINENGLLSILHCMWLMGTTQRDAMQSRNKQNMYIAALMHTETLKRSGVEDRFVLVKVVCIVLGCHRWILAQFRDPNGLIVKMRLYVLFLHCQILSMYSYSSNILYSCSIVYTWEWKRVTELRIQLKVKSETRKQAWVFVQVPKFVASLFFLILYPCRSVYPGKTCICQLIPLPRLLL